MCGLVGMMGDLHSRHKDMMADLLFLDSLRGLDSTGVACIRSNGDVHVAKTTIPGYEFVQTHLFKEGLRLTDDIWIGHNRYGTVGKNHKTNAHPFLVEDDDGDPLLVGAHNGTLKNKWEIDQHPAKYGTDSEALFNLIEDVGPRRALAQVEGAWALTWYDWAEDGMFFIRNKERPLTFAYSKDKKQFFWASEAWMLRTAASRNNVELDTVFQMNEDMLYRLDIPPRKGDRVLAELKTEGGLVGKPPKPVFQGNQANDGWPAHQKRTQTHSPNVPSTNNQPRGYQGKLMDKVLHQMILDAGCIWCEDELSPGTAYAWIGDNEPCCSKCLRDSHYTEQPKKTILTLKQVEALRRVEEAKRQSNLSSDKQAIGG